MSACVVGTPAYPTVQSAVDAPACLEISVPAGTWTENVVVARAVAIAGASTATTILSGGDAGRVLTISGTGNITLRDLTVTAGLAATDQRGQPRSNCDAGSFEVQ